MAFTGSRTRDFTKFKLKNIGIISYAINENACFMLSAKRKYIEKIIEQIDNHGVYFDGFEIFSMFKGENLHLYSYETQDRTKTRNGKGIVFNAIGAQRLTQDQIERLVWHQIQHIRTESLIKEKKVNIDKLGEIKEFKDLQNRIGKYYNYIGRSRNSSGSYFQLKYRSGFYTQDYTEILSLLKGYQIFLLQKNKGMDVVPLFNEFIGAFIPQDLDFLDEKYLFEITSSSIKSERDINIEEYTKQCVEKFISKFGNPRVYFGGYEPLENNKKRAETIGNKIVFNSFWKNLLTRDEIKRLAAHEAQHTATEFLINEKGFKYGGLHSVDRFKELQSRIGIQYDKIIKEKGIILAKPKELLAIIKRIPKVITVGLLITNSGVGSA